jgi:hypothetical protein
VKDRAAEARADALDKAAEVKDKAAAEVKDKAADVIDKAAEVRERFAPAFKDLTAEAGSLAKEAESEIRLLADQAKDIKRNGGITALMKKPDEDDIIALSRKARRKANKLERKAAKLERKLRRIEKKQLKHLKKIEKESRGQ